MVIWLPQLATDEDIVKLNAVLDSSWLLLEVANLSVLSTEDRETRHFQPLDDLIKTIQPGGGVCMRLELGWGHFRRWYLRQFRRSYLTRMNDARQGTCESCPHGILDPRDLKYFRNVCGYYWRPEDDPFTWRDRIPLARVGLAEVMIIGSCLLLLAGLAWALWWPAGIAILAVAGSILWFFRDPERAIPTDVNAVVAPADGRVVTVEQIEDEFVGSAWLIGIFLSVFNVHLNRSPMDAIVVGQSYRPGKFLNALRPQSAQENEWLESRLEQSTAPFHRMRVRQIAGAIARRIVCWVAPGHTLSRGDRFGMIKIGSSNRARRSSVGRRDRSCRGQDQGRQHDRGEIGTRWRKRSGCK